MKTSSRLFVAAVLIFVSSSSLVACSPSVDPAAKADIDRRISALAPPSQKFPAPTGFAPLPFQAGQWTQHKLIDDNGRPSFMTYKIVGEDAGAFWLETVTDTYTGRTAMKMLLAIPNRTDPNSIDIRAVTMKDTHGRITNFDGPMLSLIRGTLKGTLSTLSISWQGLPQEDATVPAGTFSGCFKTRTDAAWGPWHSASTSWSHSAVPLSGLVKSQGIDHGNSMELVAFGLSGAVSEF
ncbi:MAG TPA: hypothetical protein VNO55_07100 [Polyangia bacterium]|nr:hypothetical protein [Polyangia bacterium]